MADRLLNRSEVLARLGISKTTLHRMVRENAFPAPIQVGERATRWPESEIAAWLASRPRATGDRAA